LKSQDQTLCFYSSSQCVCGPR